jgi:hypothetical protein
MAVSCHAAWKAARHSQEEHYGLEMRTPSMKTVTLTSSQNVSRSLVDASLVIEGEEFAGNIVHYAGSQVIFESGRFEETQRNCLEYFLEANLRTAKRSAM